MLGLRLPSAECSLNVPSCPAAQLSIVEAGLEGRDYFAGESLLLADLLYAPAIAYLPMVPEGEGFLAGKPNINRRFERVSARESFAKTNPSRPSRKRLSRPPKAAG